MLCNTAQVTSQKLSKVITESITVLDGIEADLRIRVNCERTRVWTGADIGFINIHWQQYDLFGPCGQYPATG